MSSWLMSQVRSRRATAGSTQKNNNDSNSLEASTIRNSWPWWLLSGLAVLLSLLLGIFLGRQFWSGSTGQPALNDALAKEKPLLSMAIHHPGDPVTLHRDNDLDADACVLLSSCFPDRFFAARPDLNPEAPLTRCHRNLRILLGDFESGFLFEGKRLVGFLSSTFRQDQRQQQSVALDQPAIELYNVCVREEYRGRGLAKSLISMYLDTLASTHGFSSALVGLDVDFTSPTAAAAFTLYAKMGFLRWWQPCRSIGDFDFGNLQKTRFPAGWWFLNGAEELVVAERFAGFTHFCMVKEWPRDDFYRLGAAMEMAIKEKGAKKKV